MTHAQLTSNDRQGFASACPGELTELGRWPDVVRTPDGSLDRMVTVHRCRACGLVVSADSRGVILNAYEVPEPREVAGDLARALDAGRDS